MNILSLSFLVLLAVQNASFHAMGTPTDHHLDDVLTLTLNHNAALVERRKAAESIAGRAQDREGKIAVVARFPELIKCLTADEDGVVKYWIIVAMGRLGDAGKAAIPALVDMLEKEADSPEGKSYASAIPGALDAIDRDWRNSHPLSDKAKSRWGDGH